MEEWKGMISSARAFYNSCLVLENVESVVKTENERALEEFFVNSTISIIVMRSFSCEMFLKTLLVKNDLDNVKTHNLEILFNKLPEDCKTQIKTKLYSKYSDESTFEEELNKIANSFEEWRYFYEKDRKINLEFLKMFSNTLAMYTSTLGKRSTSNSK